MTDFALTEEQRQWLFGLSSPMVAINVDAEASYLEPAMWPDHKTSEFLALEDSWGISNRDDLLSTVAQMTDDGHATSIPTDYWRWPQQTPSERARARACPDPEPQHLLETFVDRTAVLTGQGGIRAWDLARMGFLLRSGYFLSYLDEAEMLHLHLQLALRARYWYQSWDQYLAGFLCGRLLWRTLNCDSADEVAELLLGNAAQEWLEPLFRELNTAFTNPANSLPWDLELPHSERPDSLPEMLT